MNFKKSVAIAVAAGSLSVAALPAFAETSIYGTVREATFWNTNDNKTTKDSNTDFDQHLQSDSILGINFSSGDISGKIEYGSTPNLRFLYGVYKFDFGKLLVGQDNNNYYFAAAQVAGDDNYLKYYGALWDNRLPQIKLTLNNGVYVAAIQPGFPAAATTENFLPKLNAGYEGKTGDFKYGAGIVGQTYKEQTAGANYNKTITSFLGYFHSTLKIDAAELLFNIGAGQNIGNMGFGNTSASNSVVAATTTANLFYKGTNTTSVEGFVQGSYILSPTQKVNVGIGYASDSNSQYAKTDNRLALFVNAPITLGKGFTLTPEFTYLDQLDSNKFAGTAAVPTNTAFKGNKDYIYGAKWQMVF